MSVVLIIATVIVIGGAIVTINNVKEIDAAWTKLSNGAVQKGIYLADMDTALGYGGMIHQFKNYVLRRTPDRIQKARSSIKSFRESAALFAKQGMNEREKSAMKEISEVVDKYESNMNTVEKLVADGLSTNQIDGMVKVSDKPALDGLHTLREEFVKARDEQTTTLGELTNGIVNLTTSDAIITGVILILVVAMLIWFTQFRLLRPMRQMVDCMNDLAKGDHTVEIHAVGRGDEIGEMADAVNVFKANASSLVSITDTIINVSREVANASKEISAGSQDLSQRTEQQAANIQESSASMAQVAATVRQNAESAEDANRQSKTARDVAEKGQSVVENTVHAMGEIEGASQKISDIIGVIDEIAFQTKLLALNASVEAARAGDAGKGFAVVATEVGNLARQSSEAAKDIKDLIVSSESYVQNGVTLVGETGEFLTKIVESVQSVAGLISDIAVASKEQSISIQEMNEAFSQMDEMTQHNSALVEESAAATLALEEQAAFLSQSVISLGQAESQQANEISAYGRRDATGTRSYEFQPPKPPATSKVEGKTARDFSFDDKDWQEF